MIPIGYIDLDFQSNNDATKSTLGFVFTLGGGAISWRSVKQSCTTDSTMEAEYVAASEAAKEAVWLRSFLMELEVVHSVKSPIILYCDNTGAVANAKSPGCIRRVSTSSVSIISYEKSYRRVINCDQDCISGQPGRSFYRELTSKEL